MASRRPSIDVGAYSESNQITSDAIGAKVANGEASQYLWSREEMVERIRRRTPDEALAEPTFKLGLYFYRQGDEPLARMYWERAQALSPDSWNFHRQDWNLTEGLAGPQFQEKLDALGQPFYEPLDLPTDR